MPVSYTHLDVYKRQPLGCSIRPLSTTAKRTGSPFRSRLRQP